jgi:hypothetical protein
MSTILRTWVAFVALGAGIIHCDLALDAPVWAAVALGMLGAAEILWGAVTFARDVVPVPRVALGVAIAPTLLWVLALVTHTMPASVSPAPLGIASLLTLAGAVILGVGGRRGSAPAPTVLRYAVALVAGALVVIALVVLALAAPGGGVFPGPLPFDEHGHTR